MAPALPTSRNAACLQYACHCLLALLVTAHFSHPELPLQVRDFVYISDRAYTRDQILNMEKIMLNALRFNLTVPSECKWLKAGGVCSQPVDSTVCLARCSCKNMLADRCPPSPSCLPCLPTGIYNFLGR